MRWSTRTHVGFVLVWVTLSFVGSARAGDGTLTAREQDLIERIRQLEERLDALEQCPGAQPPSAPGDATQLEERLERVEAAVDRQATPSADELRAYWKDGLRFETEDKRFQLGVGGRIQLDCAFFDQDEDLKYAVGDEQDGAEFRAARLNVQGRLYDSVVFRAEYDFAGDNGDGKFKDVYLGLTDLPAVGTLKVGHVREPFGLERVTGTNYHAFMELALPNVFAPNRNLGLLAQNHVFEKRATWSVGAFKVVDDFPSDDDCDEDQGFALTGRVTALPWYRDDGRRLVHLGVAYSHRNPDGASPRAAMTGWRERPESHLANRYVDTDSRLIEGYRLVDARLDDVDLLGIEAAVVLGPFHLQGEYMAARADTDFSGHHTFSGYYAQAGYFISGEHRPYNAATAQYGRVCPKRDFALKGERGWGAWEVALRYSCLDLDDGMIRGGQEQNATLGVNWYLNPNTRLMLNFIHAEIEHDLYEGDLNIFQSRFQIDF